jgi:hypothetical protein
VLTVFLLAGGRWGYAAGLYPLLFATAAVEIQRRQPAAWWRWVPTWPAYTTSALITTAIVIFFFVQSIIPQRNAWPRLAGEVAGAYHQLSPQEQRHTAVLAESCQVAAAINYYGSEHGLPRVYSAKAGWYFGAPPVDVDSVISVAWFGADLDRLRRYFTDVRRVRTRERSFWLYEGRRAPWPRIWPEVREFSII